MALSDAEFEEILSDRTKRIAGDVHWTPDTDHLPGMELEVLISSDSGRLLSLYGSWHPYNQTLFYTVVLAGTGAILRLCVGFHGHKNPGGAPLAEVHKHRWTARHKDHWAYEPNDITASWDQPVEVWRQFCAEARILHLGVLSSPGFPYDGSGQS